MIENIGAFGNRWSQHSFAQIPDVNIPRSKFNRSSALKTTFDFDYLNPIFCEEIIPGDSINLNVKSFARIATQVVPVLDNMYLDYFFFFVPCRLLWTNWERFMGAQDDPADSIDFILPTLTVNAGAGVGFTVGSIYDQFGLPTGVDDLTIQTLPLRAYNLIWKEWFRDQNLQDSPVINTDDGPDDITDYALLKRAKKHDYFTSCLPWPQKGDAVTMPLGTSAPILSTGQTLQMRQGTGTMRDIEQYQDAGTYRLRQNSASTSGAMNFGADGTTITGMDVDLSAATAASINLFRQAIMMQSLLELDARGGTRYVEIIRAHFNVVSPDFRMQRPEFLSAGTTTIVQHPIPQTSSTSGSNYIANLAAFSTAVEMGNKIGFSKAFTEHGYVIGLVQARGDVTYQQGLHKMWTRSTKHDIYWPKFQELGEQAVLNQEIYATETSATNVGVFGYQERFAEYRYKPSDIRGQFRSTYTSTLDVWHLGEEFGSLPALNDTFIQSNTPIERSLAVAASYPHVLYDAFFEMTHARPMMTYGVPATLGRF